MTRLDWTRLDVTGPMSTRRVGAQADWISRLQRYVLIGQSGARVPHIVFLDEAGRSEGQVVGKFPKQALEANVQALSVGAKTLPFAKGSFEASAVVAPDIVGAPQMPT